MDQILSQLNQFHVFRTIFLKEDGGLLKLTASSETSVNICQSSRCYILEDSHLHTCRHENSKFHQVLFFNFYGLDLRPYNPEIQQFC
jgi:hypothetical protein